MTDDIVTRLRTGSPAECYSCGEWGCCNKDGKSIPCYCENRGNCECDNECECDCHDWYSIVRLAAEEIERLRKELAEWKNVAERFAELDNNWNEAYKHYFIARNKK